MQIPRKMSAHNVMASISRTLGTRYSESKAANEIKFAGEESKDKLYEPKHKQKVVRVLTVVAYIISVSLAAIVLSLYYMYIWNPSDHPHNVAKQRLNASEAALAAATAAKIACLPQEPIAMPVLNNGSSSVEGRGQEPPPSPEFGVKDLLLRVLSSSSKKHAPSTDYPDATSELYPDDALDD